MIAIFLAATAFITLGLMLNKNTFVNYSLVLVYLALLWGFIFLQYRQLNVLQYDFFRTDSLAILILFAMGVVSIPAFFHGYRYIYTRKEPPRSRGFFFGAMVALLSASAMVYMSNHIAATWVFVEITTISASVLVYHHRNIKALEGVWKYVFISTISITFVYVGILFLSLSLKHAGVTDLSFDSLYANVNNLNPFWLKLSFLFIFTGFTVKLGLVPMYTAGIDAKDKAPAPAGALLSSVIVNVGFVTIYRVYSVVARTPLQHWANTIIIISAVLSIFVATVYMTRIKNIKRMFAYSSIEHAGLIMLGLAAGGIGVYAAILHVFLHTFVKPALFFQYNQIYRVYQSKSIYDMGQYFKYNKYGAIALLLAFFSATAMPPSGLFISEFLIFQSLFEAQHFLILIFVLILLTIVIYGFGSNVFKLLFTPPVNFDESTVPRVYPWESFSQYILLALAVYFAYFPPELFVNLLQDAVRLIPVN